MSSVLLATCSEFPDGDEDAALVTDALGRLGIAGRWVNWDDPSVDWADESVDMVVLRSTWDYMPRRDEFLAWVDTVPRLANPAPMVRWSSDKSYLGDLDGAGLPTVPTTVVRAGEDGWTWPDADEVVVKPSVGAGSRGAGRFGRPDEDAARTHLAGLLAAGRTALVQPYLAGVDTDGETAMVFLDGQFSHAIRKAPMLPDGAVHALDSDRLFVPEMIEPRDPGDDERALADSVVADVRARFGIEPLYARVDLLPSDDGPVVVELELVEPSLFVRHASGGPERAADRLAAATAARIAART